MISPEVFIDAQVYADALQKDEDHEAEPEQDAEQPWDGCGEFGGYC